MKFEWDKNKSNKNVELGRPSFSEASKVWLDEQAIDLPARPIQGESRRAMLGKIEGKVWLAIYIQTGETIRIISFRRASEKETKIYESL